MLVDLTDEDKIKVEQRLQLVTISKLSERDYTKEAITSTPEQKDEMSRLEAQMFVDELQALSKSTAPELEVSSVIREVSDYFNDITNVAVTATQNNEKNLYSAEFLDDFSKNIGPTVELLTKSESDPIKTSAQNLQNCIYGGNHRLKQAIEAPNNTAKQENSGFKYD